MKWWSWRTGNQLQGTASDLSVAFIIKLGDFCYLVVKKGRESESALISFQNFCVTGPKI